jgi:von Willebrand factor A domain-containing protein 7
MTPIVAAWALSIAFPAPGGAQAQRARQFGPGKCGPVDPVYLKTAGETGGQPFFLSPSEIAASAQIMRETSGANDTLILWASDSGGEREFSLPVDETIVRMTLSAMFDTTGGVMTIVAPDGRALSPDARIEDTPLNCGRIVTIPSPEPGLWRVKAGPSGRFWLVAHARSELDIISARFVRIGGRPGHEGLMKIAGRPPAAGPAALQINVSASGARSVEFHLMSMDGRLLQRVDLPGVGDGEFAGPVDLPSESFRVTMTGRDANDRPYQRVFNTAFRGELVELTSADAVETVQPGQDATLRIRLRNIGPRTRYRIVATHVAQVLRTTPAEVDVEEGAETFVTVTVPVAGDASPGSRLEVMVTASGDDARATMNYVMRQLVVGK